LRPPQDWRSARATLVIAAITSVAWLIVFLAGQEQAVVFGAGFIPARVGGAEAASWALPVLLTPLTAALVHGGFAHLFMNMIFLLFCGRAVETILGSRGLVILYVVGAYFAALGQWLWDPRELMPMVGASGAISAVLGAYAILFGRHRMKVKDPRLAKLLHAFWLAAAWVAIQLMIGFALPSTSMPVAIAAHIGGFLAGLLLEKPLLLLRWRGA
jgi:membrane associated rhomboid family serine protease